MSNTTYIKKITEWHKLVCNDCGIDADLFHIHYEYGGFNNGVNSYKLLCRLCARKFQQEVEEQNEKRSHGHNARD